MSRISIFLSVCMFVSFSVSKSLSFYSFPSLKLYLPVEHLVPALLRDYSLCWDHWEVVQTPHTNQALTCGTYVMKTKFSPLSPPPLKRSQNMLIGKFPFKAIWHWFFVQFWFENIQKLIFFSPYETGLSTY